MLQKIITWLGFAVIGILAIPVILLLCVISFIWSGVGRIAAKLGNTNQTNGMYE